MDHSLPLWAPVLRFCEEKFCGNFGLIFEKNERFYVKDGDGILSFIKKVMIDATLVRAYFCSMSISRIAVFVNVLGGFTTKIYARVGGLGNTLTFLLTPRSTM